MNNSIYKIAADLLVGFAKTIEEIGLRETMLYEAPKGAEQTPPPVSDPHTIPDGSLPMPNEATGPGAMGAAYTPPAGTAAYTPPAGTATPGMQPGETTGPGAATGAATGGGALPGMVELPATSRKPDGGIVAVSKMKKAEILSEVQARGFAAPDGAIKVIRDFLAALRDGNIPAGAQPIPSAGAGAIDMSAQQQPPVQQQPPAGTTAAQTTAAYQPPAGTTAAQPGGQPTSIDAAAFFDKIQDWLVSNPGGPQAAALELGPKLSAFYGNAPDAPTSVHLIGCDEHRQQFLNYLGVK